MSALNKQEGGNHYKDYAIQPVTFIHGNKLGFLEGCVIKRLCRWQRKDGIGDLRKAIHEIEVLIELTEMAEKREIDEQQTKERLAVKLGHPMTGDRLTTSAEQAVRDFVKAHTEALRGTVEATQPVPGGNPNLPGWVTANLHETPPPASLPDGTIIYEWMQSAGQQRRGFMHRGQLVRDPVAG